MLLPPPLPGLCSRRPRRLQVCREGFQGEPGQPHATRLGACLAPLCLSVGSVYSPRSAILSQPAFRSAFIRERDLYLEWNNAPGMPRLLDHSSGEDPNCLFLLLERMPCTAADFRTSLHDLYPQNTGTSEEQVKVRHTLARFCYRLLTDVVSAPHL